MNGSNFQLVVSGIFILFLLGCVAAFALFSSGGGPGAAGMVEVWGPASRETFDKWLSALHQSGNDSLDQVRYTEIPQASYETTLVNAMAAGRGPDLFMVTDEQVISFADKILTVPYSSYSQGAFTSSFIDEASLFLTAGGVRAFPIMVDPLVMYFNRDILAAAAVASPPQYWSDLLAVAPKITSHDAGQTVRRSAVAMGTWRNVAYAKPLLATLMLQAGEQFVVRQEDGRLLSVLGASGGAESPAASALRFYTEFANPQKTTYSWNASMPNSTNAFLSGDVGLYFGFASDLPLLRARNPNLRFDVAMMPQLKAGSAATYGRLTGIAVSRGAKNPEGAAVAAKALSSRDAISLLAGLSSLPPVRRDVVLDTSTSGEAGVFARSALIARGWLDPKPASTDTIFKDMIESVLSGRSDPSQAVFDAAAELGALLQGE